MHFRSELRKLDIVFRCDSISTFDHVSHSVSHSVTITLSKYNKEDLHNLHGHFKKLLTLLTFRNYKHYLPQLLIGQITSADHWPTDLSKQTIQLYSSNRIYWKFLSFWEIESNEGLRSGELDLVKPCTLNWRNEILVTGQVQKWTSPLTSGLDSWTGHGHSLMFCWFKVEYDHDHKDSQSLVFSLFFTLHIVTNIFSPYCCLSKGPEPDKYNPGIGAR